MLAEEIVKDDMGDAKAVAHAALVESGVAVAVIGRTLLGVDGC